MKRKRSSETSEVPKAAVSGRRTALKRIAAGLAGAGIVALPGRSAFSKGVLPAADAPRLDALKFDELGRVVLAEGNRPPVDSRGLDIAAETNVLCTTPGCACPPKNSTCPVNLICPCPEPPPAPLPECFCPPANSTCTPKGR